MFLKAELCASPGLGTVSALELCARENGLGADADWFGGWPCSSLVPEVEQVLGRRGCVRI